MKIKLTFKDRLVLTGLLPKEGDLRSMTLKRGIVDKTQVSSKEIEKAELVTGPDGNMKWKDTVKPVDVELIKAEAEYLKDAVAEADKEKRITIDFLDLCEKIKAL